MTPVWQSQEWEAVKSSLFAIPVISTPARVPDRNDSFVVCGIPPFWDSLLSGKQILLSQQRCKPRRAEEGHAKGSHGVKTVSGGGKLWRFRQELPA